jgi:hypothetical protein
VNGANDDESRAAEDGNGDECTGGQVPNLASYVLVHGFSPTSPPWMVSLVRCYMPAAHKALAVTKRDTPAKKIAVSNRVISQFFGMVRLNCWTVSDQPLARKVNGRIADRGLLLGDFVTITDQQRVDKEPFTTIVNINIMTTVHVAMGEICQ